MINEMFQSCGTFINWDVQGNLEQKIGQIGEKGATTT